jgi:hypothetical protein
MNFTEALNKVGAADSMITELIVPMGRLTAEPDGVHAAGERMPYDGRAFEQFCGLLRHDTPVPAGYISSLPPRMAADMTQFHLDAGLDGGDRLAVYIRGPDVIGIGDSDLVRLSGTEVLDSVLKGMGGRPDELVIDLPAFEGESLRFDIITQRATCEVLPGDVVSAGLSVRHSLIGEFATKVEGYRPMKGLVQIYQSVIDSESEHPG